ncbi:MAG: YidB family protein [Thermoanaerobaculia bacterium]
MGLLDGLIKEVGAVVGGTDPAHQTLATELCNMVTGRGGPGLQGLVDLFYQKGLGDEISSWISRHPNLPITPQQISSVLGDEKVKELAAKAGIPAQDASEVISRLLPRIVDMATPNGQTAGSPILDALSGFLSKKS